ncbi:MAG: DUF1570 domain-containing protein [Planctomycetota bacterium]
MRLVSLALFALSALLPAAPAAVCAPGMTRVATAQRALAALAAPVAPAPGDETEKHPTLGLVLARPTGYEARPVPPGQPGLLLFYAPSDAPRDAVAAATLRVYRVPYQGDPALALERWTLDTFRPRKLEPERSVRERYGRTPHRFSGELLAADGGARALFVHGWSADGDLVVVVGEGDVVRARTERRTWERCAESMRFEAPRDDIAKRTQWERYYGQRRFSQPEQRVALRLALVEGWEVRDTEHYVVLYHGALDAPLLELVALRLEALRERFLREFPPDGVVDALPVVRVCRDRGEYLTYGGESWTAGFFNPNVGELVLYDAREDASAPLDENHPLLGTLHHEACHQYLYATAGALPLHTWFDEGTAEHFAGARFRAGRLVSIEALSDRAAWLKGQLATTPGPTLDALLHMDQRTFYAAAAMHYAMAWSFVHYLRTEADPQHARLLDRYLEALKREWRREVDQLGRRGVTSASLEAARASARQAALSSALTGVELGALEAAWRAYAGR